MATVKIWKGEIRQGLLPDVCMVCGEHATDTARPTFRWCPPWVIVLILAGVLIWAIVAMILTKTMAVNCPVCDQHRGHWFKRKLWGWLLVLGGLGAIVVGGVAAALLDPGPGRGGGNDLSGLAILAGLGMFLVLLIAGAVVMNSGIQPAEITDRTITLKKVHEVFVDALEEDRDREEEEEEREYEERRARRRSRGDRDG